MLRLAVTGAIEIARANKLIGSSLEAAPRIYLSNPEHLRALEGVDFAEVCITSDVAVEFGAPIPEAAFRLPEAADVGVVVERASGVKCARSWRYFDPATASPDFPDVSPRDAEALRELKIAGPLAVKPPVLGGIVALVVVIVDQITKIAVLSRSDQLAVDSAPLTPFLDLTLQWNRGISFSLFARNSASAETVLLALTLAATALLAWWLSRSRSGLPAVGLGLIIGGPWATRLTALFMAPSSIISICTPLAVTFLSLMSPMRPLTSASCC